jgi:succinoglycan biosynthesis protein ExoL
MNAIQKPNVLLLAHDLSDAGIARRIQMLQSGGADVTVAGFRRTTLPITNLYGCLTVDFGETRNGRFIQRIFMILRALRLFSRSTNLYANSYIIIARNLEMLAIAVVGTRQQARRPVVIYEILDIHRLLLGSGVMGRAMRWLERFLLRHAHAIFTSSPAFITQYFCKLNPTKLPIRLIENKLLNPLVAGVSAEQMPAIPLPWIIGWFGIIRCKRSLHILADLVRLCAGRVHVVIRGRPALDQIPKFHDVVTSTPGLHFGGPYNYPNDLGSMYRAVHFSWTIDLYEEGLNSTWLLPNRLYEGDYFGTVPIAVADVETGRYLRELGIGVLLAKPSACSLMEFMMALTPDIYLNLSAAVRSVPTSQWTCTTEDCKDLVRFMYDLHPAAGKTSYD